MPILKHEVEKNLEDNNSMEFKEKILNQDKAFVRLLESVESRKKVNLQTKKPKEVLYD